MQATVTRRIGHLDCVEKLPVVCQSHGDIEAALAALQNQPNRHTQRRIHVLETNQPPYAPRMVYVGAMGLRGGGGEHYVKVAPDSDSDDPSQENPKVSFGSNSELDYCDADFFPASDGDWKARVRYSGGYSHYDEHRWVKASYPGLRLSSNDLGACRTSVNYTWSWFHTNVNYIEVLTPPSKIDADRRARRQARQRRKEAQRQAHEAAERRAREEAERRRQAHEAAERRAREEAERRRQAHEAAQRRKALQRTRQAAPSVTDPALEGLLNASSTLSSATSNWIAQRQAQWQQDQALSLEIEEVVEATRPPSEDAGETTTD